MQVIEGVNYVFSLNGEDYECDTDYIKENIANHNIVYVAKREDREHKHFIDVKTMLTDMQERADGESEWADDYLIDANKEHIKNIEELILGYMNENLTQPGFFTVENVQKISVAEFRKLFC